MISMRCVFVTGAFLIEKHHAMFTPQTSHCNAHPMTNKSGFPANK